MTRHLHCQYCCKGRKFELVDLVTKWWRCIRCGKTRRAL